MAKMQDSGIEWLGEIPAHWEVIKLFVLFQEHKCKNFGLQEKNLLSLSYGKIIRKDINTSEGLLPTSFENYNIIEKGYIVFRLTDLQNDKHSLRTGLCKERGIITSAYVTLKLKSGDIPEYMHFLFHAYDVCKVFYGMGDGVRQGMNYSDLKKLWIIRPPVAEQKKIANFLDRKCSAIDSAVDAAKKLVEKLREYKKSLITETVTKGLNPSVEMKIKYIAILNPPCSKTFLPEDKLSYIPMECVKAGYLIPQEKSFRDIISGLTYFENGDIIFAKVTPCFENGNIAIAENLTNGVAYGSSELFVLRCFGLEKKFLFYVLQSDKFKNTCVASMTGVAGLKRVSSKTVMNYVFLFPSLAKQKEIVNFLDKKCVAIDENISKREKLIEKLSEYKKSLIYEVVTGKVEV